MSVPVIAMIAAMTKDRVIGKNNQMPWHLPADLKHFKAVTMGKPIIMGRRTFESIGQALPGRQNIVLTRDVHYQAKGCDVVHDWPTALQEAETAEEIMIIGGGNLYQQLLPLAQRLYLTVIDIALEGDTFFPEYEQFQWHEIERVNHVADDNNPYDYCFLTLERVEKA